MSDGVKQAQCFDVWCTPAYRKFNVGYFKYCTEYLRIWNEESFL